MNSDEKYYIILVNFNAWKDTVECLESIRESSYKNVQTIIVDNCSQDDSLLLMKKSFDETKIKYVSYKSNEILQDKLPYDETKKSDFVVIIQAEENRGFAAGNNIGIKYAKLRNDSAGVILLNNDTIVEKTAFENLIKAKSQTESYAIYSGKILYYSEPGTIWFDGGQLNYLLGNTKHIGYNQKNMSWNQNLKEVNFITFCYVLIPFEVLNKVGFLDETYFMYFEDTDYCYKVNSNGVHQYIVEDSIIYHKVGKSSGGKFSPFLFYWYYRNFIVFNRRRRDALKILSLFIITLSRPLIFLKIFLHNKENAKIMFKATIDGYKYKLK
jgi:hypothetical protein